MNTPLDPQHAEALTFQQYGAQPKIDGVFFHALTKHRGLEGGFMEFLRLTAGEAESLPIAFEPRQISVSAAVAGRINAFHLHPKVVQDECWCVIAGAMKVWLVDVRTGSPTLNVKRAYLLSGEQPGMLHIPAGVAHGYKAGPAGATLLYVMNSQFDPAEPNEGRLPW
ncbi:MAG: dTDP-4-dehydrorhamnose 3,5-epimerase, partial [Hyphomicrobiales bacterium]